MCSMIVLLFFLFLVHDLSANKTHTNSALEIYRKSHFTLAHLNLCLVCNNAHATSCPPCEPKNGAFQMIRGMKAEFCCRGSVGSNCNGEGKAGDKEGHGPWEWSSKVFYQSQLTHFKILSDVFGSSDLQILDFYKLLPLQLLLTFAILNRSLELKETDAYFRDEVAI